MEHTYYILLIHKQLAGEITASERSALELWLAQDEKHRRTFEIFQQMWREPDPGNVSSERKQNQRMRLLDRVKADSRERGLHRLRVHRIAAMLVFAVASAIVVMKMISIPVTITVFEKKNVWLEDNGQIILQPHAAISFYYSRQQLTASFEGEALFELANAAAITLPGATVYASAASFLIRSGPDGDAFIEVLSGAVTISVQHRDIVVHANQQCIIDKAGLHVSRLHERGS